MYGTKYTEYEFEVRKTIKVSMRGDNTDSNYEKALQEAMGEIESDWLSCVSVHSEMEYEEEVV